MSRKLDPFPAIQSLVRDGWMYSHPLSKLHNVAHMRNSERAWRNVQFRGREHSANTSGQWLYGIYVRDFSNVEDMVLWSHDEPQMLVLPTAFLKELFDPLRARVDNCSRWHVNVYFTRFGAPTLVPVYYGRHYNVAEFAVPFKS